jgi:hypothetical protein
MIYRQSQIWKTVGAIVSSLVLGAAIAAPAKAEPITSFELYPNDAVIACMAADPNVKPTAKVLVKPGELNDQMVVALSGFKPGLTFSLFTVESSPLQADGNADPNFKNFGLAWYQSEVTAGITAVRTILIDEPFGFNPNVNMPPTRTLHVGFWFADPNDAAACGFDPSKPTPFDGDLEAGPVGFISRPNAATGLGPLCTDPDACKTTP